MRFSAVSSALVALLVGFGGSVAIVLAAAQALGASPVQTSSWFGALWFATGVTSLILGWRHKMPIITAWSTPGAALIASSSGIGMEAAIGAFIVAAILIVATALFKPLAKLIASIPAAIASAMLAGVLIRFVFPMFDALRELPIFALPVILLYFVLRVFNPLLAVIAAFAGGFALVFGLGLNAPIDSLGGVSQFTLIVPQFDLPILVGLGLPLYLVTMASQNIPGFAVLKGAGYEPPVQSSLMVTGLVSLITAPLGAHMTNMAAITAAICTGPDTHPDASRRWVVSMYYGALNIGLVAIGGLLISLMLAMPAAFIATIAGLALLGPLTSSLGAAMTAKDTQGIAVVTFVVSASGLTVMGIGSAFWGLVAGLLLLGLDKAVAAWRS